MKYSVKLTDPSGQVSYLTVGYHVRWSKRVALKHAREFCAKNAIGYSFVLEED